MINSKHDFHIAVFSSKYVQGAVPLVGGFHKFFWFLVHPFSPDLGRDTSFCRADFPVLTSSVYNVLCMSTILYSYELVTSEVKYLCSITPCVFPPLSKNFWLQSFSCNNSQTQLLGFSVTHPLCSLLC